MPSPMSPDLMAAILAEDMARIQALLPACVADTRDGEARLPEGLTPLMVAAACGREDLVEALLQQGADPARRDPGGRSAAAYARAAGHPHLAERLDTVIEKENTIW